VKNYHKISIINDEISHHISQAIKYCLKKGIKFLELRTINKTNLLMIDKKELLGIKKKLDKNHIKVSCIASPLFKWHKKNFTNDEKECKTYSFSFPERLTYLEKKQFIKKAIEVVDIFSAPYIRIFSVYREDQIVDKFWKVEKGLFNYLFELTQNSKIKIIVENGYNVNFHSSSQITNFQKIFKNTPIKLLLDPANTYIIKDPIEEKDYKKIIPNIEYLHLKDFSFKKNKVDILGQGDINYVKFFKTFFKYAVKPIFISLEPENYDQDINIVDKSLAYLSKLIIKHEK
jgi:sugar phosphate isomerase/epimerase